MWSELQFNTLLFLTDEPSPNVNETGSRLRRLYVRQALSLARSLNRCGKNLRIFTNSREALDELIVREKPLERIDLQVTQVEFPSWPLPKHASFFAAHHKLFLFSHLAEDAHPNCLIDADVIVNHNMLSLAKLLDQSPEIDGWVYDISDQVFPAYGTQTVQADLRSLGVRHPFPRWYGGEFIMGGPRLFAYLHEQCQCYIDSYLNLLPQLHHVGDECIVSAALNHNGRNLALADAGASGFVVRQWTGRTLHVGKPCRILKDSLLWHLPDAKRSLSRYCKHGSLATLYRSICCLTFCRRVVQEPRAWARRMLLRL